MSEWVNSLERTPGPCDVVLGYDGRVRKIVQWVGHIDPERPWNMTDGLRYDNDSIYQPLEAIPLWAEMPPHPSDMLDTVIAQIDE